MVIMTTLPSECKTCKKNKERLLIKQIHYKVMIGRRAFKHAHIAMHSRDRMKNLNDGCMMLVLMTLKSYSLSSIRFNGLQLPNLYV